MKVQYVSDIHIEHSNGVFGDEIKPIAPILVLAGDICPVEQIHKYSNFIRYCSEHWQRVLLVAGNHEYYNSPGINSVDSTLSQLSSLYSNVHFLQKSSYVYKDVVFIGATLWSHIPPHARYDVVQKINDYNYIPEFTVAESNRLHNDHADWIMRQLQSYKGFSKVVISHHTPIIEGTSNPIYRNQLTNHAFSTDLFSHMNLADYWICGHTHWRTEFLTNGCQVMLNCYGYPGELPPYQDRCFDVNRKKSPA